MPPVTLQPWPEENVIRPQFTDSKRGHSLYDTERNTTCNKEGRDSLISWELVMGVRQCQLLTFVYPIISSGDISQHGGNEDDIEEKKF